MCSLAYSPPEVVHLVQNGDSKMTAEKAVDMWALGVIAFELLTKTRVFPSSTSQDQAMRILCGLEPLPWEEGAEGAEEKLQMLKGLKNPVLKCLARDPEARPTADGVQRLLGDLFEVSAGISQFEVVAQPAI
jgi:serine/threonine protein kinase